MKAIKNFLQRKKFGSVELDEKTIFFIFSKVVEKEYGRVGKRSWQPSFYKNGKIFIKAANSNWASELWLCREDLKNKVNEELGKDEIKEIKLSR